MTNNFRLIRALKSGEEQGFINSDADFDIGSKNDFEIKTKIEDMTLQYNDRVFIPGTEFGGLVEVMQIKTATNEKIWSGYTWRGLLEMKAVRPPQGSSHLVVSGDLIDCAGAILGDKFGTLFQVSSRKTGVILQSHKVDRYINLKKALENLVKGTGHKLVIRYLQKEGKDYGHVEIGIEKIKDLSEEIEYSQENDMKFTVKDARNGINHLVCIGKGEGEERTVIDLYLQKDGSIGETPYFQGQDEREYIYEYSSLEADALKKEGLKKFEELKNNKKISVDVQEVDIELDDVVTGYEKYTDTRIKKAVTGKILRVKQGISSIEYKVEGDV